MATLNGDTEPSTITDSDSVTVTIADHASHKRKRDELTTDTALRPVYSQSRTKHIQKDILDVLERHDSKPSFLHHPLNNEPSQKKAKLSDSIDATSTIAAKLSATSYTSLQEIRADAALVTEALVSAIRTEAKNQEGGRPSLGDLKHIRRVQMIEALVKDIVDKESEDLAVPGTNSSKHIKEENAKTNGVAAREAVPVQSSMVLTLFGNAPTPKQLFSSMQKPPAGPTGSVMKSELPVEEMSLPNGITATSVVPIPTSETKGPTFEEIFAPPNSLPALLPPKSHKKSATRDKDISWEFKDLVQRNRKGGYTVQPLTVGMWLNYGGIDPADATATREKRKERNRALSSSAENTERPSRAAMEEAQAKDEEALFRRAYSSFAPSCDNSSSVVPAEVRNRVWWHKVGNKRYNETFAIDPALLDETEPTQSSVMPAEQQAQDDRFENVLNEIDELEDTQTEPEPVASKINVEHILHEVSELLETLASYQRIRNATLAPSSSASRPPTSPSPSLAPKIGKPDEPSEEELATYDSLRRELAYLILKLPPYAVAKLNGDQLDDLAVSKLITFQAKDTKGTMEEDLVTRQAKLAAMTSASSITSLTRPNSSAGQHYSSTANRTPAIGQAANTRYGQQYGSRTPIATPSFQRHSSSTQSYGTPTSTAPRVGYAQSNQWSRPGAALQGYGQQGNQQYYQRSQQTSSSTTSFNQYQQPRYPAQTQQYQPQRTASQSAAANAVGYQTSPSHQAFNRTTSPVKGFSNASIPPATQHRPLYQAPSQSQQPRSGRATPTGPPSQPNTPVNGFGPPPRQPQGIAPRPASSTPQPPPSQSPAPVQPNGTT